MIVLVWITKAIEGDPRFLQLLLDRIEGKIKATLEVSGGEPCVVNVTIVGDDGDGGAGPH
jgi:hypothetical protein